MSRQRPRRFNPDLLNAGVPFDDGMISGVELELMVEGVLYGQELSERSIEIAKEAEETVAEAIRIASSIIRGKDGTIWFTLTAGTTTLPSIDGIIAIVNDLILNGSMNDITVAGRVIPSGGFVRITSAAPFQVSTVIGELAGPKGERGARSWAITAAITNISQVSGAVIGDEFVNAGTATFNILGISTAIGGVVRSTSATAGTAAGNIRGPQGPQGTVPRHADFDSFTITNGQQNYRAEVDAQGNFRIGSTVAAQPDTSVLQGLQTQVNTVQTQATNTQTALTALTTRVTTAETNINARATTAALNAHIDSLTWRSLGAEFLIPNNNPNTVSFATPIPSNVTPREFCIRIRGGNSDANSNVVFPDYVFPWDRAIRAQQAALGTSPWTESTLFFHMFPAAAEWISFSGLSRVSIQYRRNTGSNARFLQFFWR
jgi:hypothetical protein